MAKKSGTDINLQIKTVRENIKKRTLAPVYLLKGEEPYYIDLLCNEFENIIPPDAKDFNLSVFYGKDTLAEQIISSCRQYPMMADLKVVILKEAQLFDKKQWPMCLSYFQSPIKSTVLVICQKGKLDANGKGFDLSYQNTITKNGGVVIESSAVADYNIPKWIENYIKDKGLNAGYEEIRLLSDSLGNNLSKIANEIDKLLINIKNTKNISVDDISKYIGISRDYNVFELQKALGQKQIFKANQILDYFEKNPKDNPIQMIIPVLFGFFSKLLTASQSKARTADSLAIAIGVNKFAAKDYLFTLNNYNTLQLLRIMDIFSEYDLKSKGIGKAPLTSDICLLKELVYKILHV